MEVTFITSLINMIGDSSINVFGYRLFKIMSSENIQLVEELKNYLSPEEHNHFLETLKLLEESLVSCGASPLGILLLSKQTSISLRARIAVEKVYAQYQEIIDKTTLKPQLIITGQFRTGSTLLHTLLSKDPHARTLTGWEMQSPTPFPTKQTYENDKRIQEVANWRASVDYLISNFNKYVRMYHDHDGSNLEEEYYIYHQAMLGAPLFSEIPNSYEQDICDPNKSRMREYGYLKKFLTMNQFFHPPKSHWALKCPWHGLYMKELTTTFDDSTIIVTHRNPNQTVPSFTKLIMFMVSIGTRDLKNNIYTKELFGKVICGYVRKVTDGIEKAYKEIFPHSKHNVIDIEYRDLVADPIGTVKMIYSKSGREFTPEYEKLLQDYLAKNEEERKKSKGSAHEPYSLEEFGLTKEYIREQFKDYMEKHGYE